LNKRESIVEDLLRGGRDARATGLMARLAVVLKDDGEFEIFVPCLGCATPVQLAGAPDERCRECRRAD